uniref:VWFC domain-containing protein n=1 Tax=Mola mola TaxID=94237 RepID=A0A3Q3WRN3_MOLML
KQGQCVYQGLTMFDQAVWSPKPCVTCLCTGGRVVCDEITCPITHCHFPFTPTGECCPVCMEPLDLSGDSPVPNEPYNSVTPLTQEEIQRILWREEEEHLEEKERLRKKDEVKKKRKKHKKEQAEIQRKLVEERRKAEQKALRLELEKEDEERRKQIEEIERRRQEEKEDRRQRQAAEREAREYEKRLEEERRRQEEMLRKELLALEEDEEEYLEEQQEERLEDVEERQEKEDEEEVWLRGDVFQMPPKEPEEPKEPNVFPGPIPKPPAVLEDKLKKTEAEEEEDAEVVVVNRGGLPPGCDISDVTVTCDNAKLMYFPPLSIPELKSLSLENNISSIPAEAFNGIPNLEWVNLKKNKLTSAGIGVKAFKGLKMLRRLYLDGNLLEVVPADLPPPLQELKISENRLRRIDENSFHDLSSLVILELEGNLLSEGNVDPLAFAPLIQLSYLRLGRNHFRTIPQGLPKSLLELYLENNLIEEISETVFNQSQNLNVVSLRHNRLDETRIAPLAWINRYVFAHMEPGLEYLYLSYNKLDGEGVEPESFFGSYSSMVELCLDNNQLITVPSGINEMTNLHFLRLNNNKIICDPDHRGDATLVALRLENNYIDPQKVSRTAFSCIRASSSVILKPQKTK